MSTPVNSTHQQDRAAQQKLVNARQNATAQGPQQGGGFSRLLSLACDEDTDLDALNLAGQLFGLKTQEPTTDTEAGGSTRRKTGKGSAGVSDKDAATEVPVDGLHPSAQANATLLALLTRAQAESAPSDAQAQGPGGSTAAVSSGTDVPTGAGESAVAVGQPSETSVIDEPATDTASAQPLPQVEPDNTPAPGKAVRDLARQLGAAMRNVAPGQDSAAQAGAQANASGAAWGRQPMAEVRAGASATSIVANDPLTPPLATEPTGPAAMALGASAHLTADPDTNSTDGDSETSAPDQATPLEVRATGREDPSHNNLGGETLGGTEMTETAHRTEDVGNQVEQWREQWADAMEQMGQQVSYWVQQGGVRQATLRVGNGWQQAMDVKLSMKNGQAEIEFLTDHEAARSAIAEGGTEVLRELLAQSGIDLGQVSIGAQNAGSGASTPQEPFGRTGKASAGSDAPETPAASLQPRHRHSTGLDVYV